MTKIYYNWTQIEELIEELQSKIVKSNWTPDLLIGIARGGTIITDMLSRKLNVPYQISTVQLRDGDIKEVINCWELQEKYKRILIIDEINDSGATFKWIMDNWIIPNDDIKTCSLFEQVKSNFKTDYIGEIIDDEVWRVFPWE